MRKLPDLFETSPTAQPPYSGGTAAEAVRGPARSLHGFRSGGTESPSSILYPYYIEFVKKKQTNICLFSEKCSFSGRKPLFGGGRRAQPPESRPKRHKAALNGTARGAFLKPWRRLIFLRRFRRHRQLALLQQRVSALRLSGTLAAGTHRKSNRPFTPAKQNAAKPPARRIFRRTFRPPGKIRLKPTKPDACRQAEPADRHPLKSAGRRPRPSQPSRPVAPATPAAFRRQPRSRACGLAAAIPCRDRTAVRTSSVRSLPPSASARPLSGIFSDCLDRPKTAHAQRRMPPPKMQGWFLRHSSAPEGRSAIGLKTAALNELHPKTIRENTETEYRPNARFLNRHSGPIAKKAAALSHGPNFYLCGGTIGNMAHSFALAHSKTIRLRLLLHVCARCIRQQHSHRHAGSVTARISLHICPGSAAAADRAQAGASTNARPLVRTFAAALPTRLHGSKTAHTTAQNTRMTHT